MNKILLVGVGGCGGRLVDAGITQSKKAIYNDTENVYSTALINSNIREMEKLQCYDESNNALAVSGGGSARDKDDAKVSIMKEQESFMRFLFQRTKSCKSVLILVGAGGGVGSAAAPAVANFIRQLDEKIIINMLAVMPSDDDDDKEFDNAKSFINDMQKLLGLTEETKGRPIINSYMYVNNNMMGGKTKAQFNAQIMKLVIESMELKGGVDLDQKDMLKINGALGYKVILPLSSGVEMEVALKYSISHSLFYIPDELKAISKGMPVSCKSLGATLCEEDYTLKEVDEFFKSLGLSKVDVGNSNFIVAAGLKQPKSDIDAILKMAKIKQDEAKAVEDDVVVIDVEETQDEFTGFKTAQEQNEEKLNKMKTSMNSLFF